MFKKLSLICLSAVLAVSLVACGGGGAAPKEADPDQTYVWKLAHEESETEFQHFYALKFKETIEASSGGKVTVEVYPVGQLGDSTNQVELLQAGGIEFGINNPGSSSTIIPEANVFSLHFLLPSDTGEINTILNEGEGIKYLNELYEKQDMHVLNWFPTAFNAWTADKPLRTPDDFKGFKIRTMAAPVIAKSYEAYGASAVAIPYTELYSALQLKMVDGQVNPLYGIAGMKFHEVQKYLMLSSPDCFVGTMCANTSFWSTLPDDLKQQVTDAAAAANAHILDIQDTITQDALDTINAAGNTEIIELTEDERNAFKEIAEANRSVYTGIAGDSGQKLLDLIQADIAK